MGMDGLSFSNTGAVKESTSAEYASKTEQAIHSDDIIELYDSATNRLIETISGNELGELVQKLNMASGIFVNKKV